MSDDQPRLKAPHLKPPQGGTGAPEKSIPRLKEPQLRLPKPNVGLPHHHLRRPKPLVLESKAAARGLADSELLDVQRSVGEAGLNRSSHPGPPSLLPARLPRQRLQLPISEGFQPAVGGAEADHARGLGRPNDRDRGLTAPWPLVIKTPVDGGGTGPLPISVSAGGANLAVKQAIIETCRNLGHLEVADLALAIAMQEESSLEAQRYPFGDLMPIDADNPTAPPAPKTGDNANYGVFKMNWGMIKNTLRARQGASDCSFPRPLDRGSGRGPPSRGHPKPSAGSRD